MKIKLLSLFIFLFSLQTNAQSFNPTSNISSPNASDTFAGGYTFSYATAGSPWNGALISFGGFSNQYDCQISTDYGVGGGNHLSFRTRNGDIAQWNPWNEIWNSSNLNNLNSDFVCKNFFSVGKVGIGTTNPDQKLTVKGKIHAEEIIVDLAVPADYVFKKYYTGKSELKSDYTMPTLAEIESFTKENHHLPNVPSALEIQQNGLSLGEMSNVLLQKIEELTLYAIEQNKKVMMQQEDLERLKTENENYKSLAERLSSIEKALKK